jgi:hypothetical protein
MSVATDKQAQYVYAEPKPFRHCKSCKERVPKENFWKDKSQWDGLDLRCKGCNKDRMKARRYRVKMKIINYLGGECKMCGNTLDDIHYTAFDCNHLDPTKKSYTVSKKQISMPWELLKSELDKCELLCSNCHRETTFKRKDTLYRAKWK